MVNLANYYEGENRPAFLHVLSVFGYRAWDCCLFYSVPDRPEGPTAGTESARELCVLIVSSVCGLLFETDRPEFFVQPGYFGLGVGGEGQTAVAAVDADEFHAGFAAADAAAVAERRAEGELRSRLLDRLIAEIEKRKKYPRQARRSGAEGTCTLEIRVDAAGVVQGCGLAKGSGSPVLDAATSRLAGRLAGLNTGVRGKAFRVLIPVRYSLRDN